MLTMSKRGAIIYLYAAVDPELRQVIKDMARDAGRSTAMQARVLIELGIAEYNKRKTKQSPIL